jgi:hypothetical protein
MASRLFDAHFIVLVSQKNKFLMILKFLNPVTIPYKNPTTTPEKKSKSTPKT